MKTRFLLLLLLLAMGCRTSQPISKTDFSPPEYSLIYVIHGDGNYLYHTANGRALQADEQKLKEAQKVGRNAQKGEVFIFHQKPEQKILGLFPKKDRTFLHYRNGKLIYRENYSPRSKNEPLTAEAALFNKYKAKTNAGGYKNIFLYFGHEIPVRKETAYYASRPNVSFNTERFVGGMQDFLAAGKFDLTVLSTCNNGTPSMIQALAPLSRLVLASPQNLHLSHIDTQALPRLLDQAASNSAQIADSLAENTYQRLSSFLQTVITLSVYDTRETQTYLPPLSKAYEQHLQTLSRPDLLKDNTDCTNLSFFELTENSSGVKVWYKPPRFGLKKQQQVDYSGWGCKK